MELLILLASREGQLVTRSEIADRLWASEVFVDTEHGINTAIRKLRYLLRDDPDHPQFIQTVIGMGYRFIAPITSVQKPSSEAVRPGAALVEAASMDPVQPNEAISAEALTGAPTLPTPNPRYPAWVGLTALAALVITIPIVTLGAHPWVNACSIATRNPSSAPWLCFPSTTSPEIPLRTTSPMA